MESKICPTCEQDKELSEYYSQFRKDGTIYYRRECKKCVGNRSIKWMKDNPESYAKQKIEYAKTEKRIKFRFEEGVKQRKSGYYLGWQRNNPDKCQGYSQQHDNHDISEKEWEACKKYFNYKCAYCGMPLEDHWVQYAGKMILGDFHKEHKIHDGSNGLENCIPACKSCNSSKHTAIFEEWYNIHNPNFTKSRYNKIIKWCTEDYKQYLKPRKDAVLV